MKGILALLFFCAASQFAHGHYFSTIRPLHGLIGPKLLGMTASVLSVIGSAYSDTEESQSDSDDLDLDDSLESIDPELLKQSRAFFGAVNLKGGGVRKRLCMKLCKDVFNEVQEFNKTEFLTPNSITFRFFKTRPKQESVKLKVKAGNDAYVALASGLGQTDRRYEVRFGLLANYQTFITKDRFGTAVANVITPQILSKEEFRKFWIKWDDGTIRVGKGNETHAFIAYADPKLFEVSYLGFGTRWGAQGTWIVEGIGNESSR